VKIAEFLREELVFPDLAATDKAGVLGEISAGLARVLPQISAQRLADVLLEREKLGSTGVGEGVAIPHGKLSGIPGLVAAFGRSLRGVEFAAIDGKPTQLFFVLLAPENSAGLHLKALARISRLFKQPQLRQQLLSAQGASGIYRLIIDEDSKY
jgi:PTS system nitrogen regulatory IIA component